MHKPYSSKQKISGFTLVEILIATGLLLALTGSAALYLSNSSDTMQKLMSKQSNKQLADAAYQIIDSALQKAAFTDCAGVFSSHRSSRSNFALPPVISIKLSNSNNWSPAIADEFHSPRRLGNLNSNGELLIQTIAEKRYIIQNITNQIIELNDTDDLHVGDWLWLSNCQFTRLGQIQRLSANTLELGQSYWMQHNNQPLIFELAPGNRAYKLSWQHFYLRKDSTANNKMTLYRKTDNKRSVPLLTGIDSIGFDHTGITGSSIVTIGFNRPNSVDQSDFQYTLHTPNLK